MISVLLILGLLAGMAAPKFGQTAYESASAEGFARKLVVDVGQARRRAIATGDDHYLQFNSSGGSVISYTLFHDASGGAVEADDTIAVPSGATATTASSDWTFDFAGTLVSGGSTSTLRVDGPKFYWVITVYQATGKAMVDKHAQ